MRSYRSAATALALLLVVTVAGPVAGAPTATTVGADQAGAPQSAGRPVVRYASRSDTSAALRNVRPLPTAVTELTVKTRKLLPNRVGSGATAPDPALQAPVAGAAAPTVAGSGFEGIGNRNGVLPPDMVGDIGPNHYVQMVNLSYAVYDRNGALLVGPLNANQIWSGFGGPCETSNDGDPVVQYDHLADRWVLSQFALPRFPRGPFYECVAVSETGDPTGAFYRYEFLISNSKLNDYPKLGVWPDGYYMSINQFSCRMIGCSWAGAGSIVFERDAMLSGGAARMVYFDLYSTDPDLGGMLPSDLDGLAPPAGTPNLFAQIDDNAWGYSPDQIQLWAFDVDWANPGASTFTNVSALTTASFDTDLCGYSRNCIAQPGGTKLDALSDRLMYRLQYRSFAGYQAMVLNHTVDANGADRAGIRWYELRNSGSGWAIRQQATFSPDSANRWIGSVAMNGAGDIGLGYSVSSSSVSPSIRVTGRAAGDPLNQMASESTLIAGSGYQTHTSGRWGDYSSLSVDPTDDCTFWYTGEYYNSVSSAGWRTRIGSFKVSDCGGTPTTGGITGTVRDAATSSVIAGATVQITGGASTTTNASGVYTFSGLAPATYSLTASATGYQASAPANVSVVAGSTATQNFSLTASTVAPIQLSVAGRKVKGVQHADLTWGPSSTGTFDVYRDTLKVNSVPVSGGTYDDNIGVKGGGQTYVYQVCPAGDLAGGPTCSNEASVTF